MATRGNESKSALLVIDVQNGVMANGWRKDEVIANCAAMVEHARATNVPVIWIQHQAEDLPRDSDAWQMVPELVPVEGEAHVYKEYSDSFADTDLGPLLDHLGIGHLMITGAQTNACVRATTYRAAGEGYDVTLVADAHTTESIDWAGVQVEAESMVNDLNLTMQFLEWPSQKVTSLDTAAVLAQ